jgi:hypothetical protein
MSKSRGKTWFRALLLNQVLPRALQSKAAPSTVSACSSAALPRHVLQLHNYPLFLLMITCQACFLLTEHSTHLYCMSDSQDGIAFFYVLQQVEFTWMQMDWPRCTEQLYPAGLAWCSDC